MYFSKSYIAAATVFLGLGVQAHAHAGVQPALGVNGAFARSNVQRPSTAKPCGNVDVAKNIDKSSVAVTGLSCRFPGEGGSLNGFWNSICDGKCMLTSLATSKKRKADS